MSNQTILWSMLVLPWLTLLFMKKETIKRFMPVALFSAVTSIILVEAGEALRWFAYEEATYPLRTHSYIIFGLNMVITLWLFKFLFGRFWTYLAIDVVLNFSFIYLFHVYFLGGRGLFQEIGLTPSLNAVITSLDGVLVYGYQIWQEGILIRSEKSNFYSRLQPAAKPVADKHDYDEYQDKE